MPFDPLRFPMLGISDNLAGRLILPSLYGNGRGYRHLSGRHYLRGLYGSGRVLTFYLGGT